MAVNGTATAAASPILPAGSRTGVRGHFRTGGGYPPGSMKACMSLVFVAACAAGVVGSGLTTAVASTTPPPPPPSSVPPTVASPTTTAPAPTTTTLPPVPPGVFNPACARVVRPGDSISLIADEIVPPVAASALLAENVIGPDHVLQPGDLLDVCVGNEVNDLNGASRARPATTLIPDANPEVVKVQQQKLNELFGPYGMNSLTVDGASGPLTRQQLCAARVFLGLPISRSDMAPGSPEEAALLALTSLPIPPGAPTDANHWALLDMTCQVLIAGDGASALRFVLPTSTGDAGFETAVVSEAAAFRFDPAVDNDGWHDSSEFPAAYDNPLNGNMYKPIYFNNGQALHGANNVPPRPASKGCARLSVANQDAVIAWLGLGEAGEPVWREGEIGLTVTTQGGYLPDP